MSSECEEIAPLIAGAVDDQLDAEQWETLVATLRTVIHAESILSKSKRLFSS